MTRVSVIIPVRDVPRELIARALESVWAQSYADLEAVIVDDGSREPIQLSWFHTAARVRLVRLPRSRGVAGARNEGCKVAEGRWFVWLDGDDELGPHCVDELMLASRGMSLVIGECIVHEGASEVRRRPRSHIERAVVTHGTPEDELLRVVFSLQAQAIHRDAFAAIGGFDPSYEYAEMTDLFLRYAARFSLPRLAVAERAVYHYYRERPESMSQIDRRALFNYRKSAMLRYAELMGIEVGALRYIARNEATGFQLYSPEGV